MSPKTLPQPTAQDHSALVTELTPFDLLATVEEVVRQRAGAALDKGLELKIRYLTGTPQHLVGDAGRIRQALLILLDNAIEFTSRGRVVVAAQGEKIRRGTAALRLRVEDTGIGIPEADLQGVFSRSGRGLALCKQMIEGMGGRIGALSVRGKGSVFWISLTLPLDSSRRRRSVQSAIMSGP